MVAEKEGESPPKERPPQLQEPLRPHKRTKKQVSDGFTIKAMMKNTVENGYHDHIRESPLQKEDTQKMKDRTK